MFSRAQSVEGLLALCFERQVQVLGVHLPTLGVHRVLLSTLEESSDPESGLLGQFPGGDVVSKRDPDRLSHGWRQSVHNYKRQICFGLVFFVLTFDRVKPKTRRPEVPESKL